ncbi:MAG: methionine biosynthesis protein MetW [Alphaproteobacteria bacterium]|nr:methionine biosynthesis protein MetW [Alphaproteobacteria bacterium]MBF0250788.1 methionine biosynthesis protein MetW [Alphaproteobacteria bacterium]
MTPDNPKAIRVDLQLIADMIEPGTRVLDVGCGNGTLLDYLWHFKQVDGRGIEISTQGVQACVSAGLSVVQGDVERDLKNYPDDAFDYVILSQTLQAMWEPRDVMTEMMRIGKRGIVSLPNFGYWRLRLYLMFHGRMPVSENLPYQWYNTPNIHFCTIRDFVALVKDMGLTIERSLFLDDTGTSRTIGTSVGLANWFGEQGVFLLRK